MDIAIIGLGWVGRAVQKLFPCATVYDPLIKESTKKAVNDCGVSFICVPSPNPNEGKLDTSIVEEVISWCSCPLIVIRSTVNPGDSDKWAQKYKKNIIIQPEYLGETPNHPYSDMKTRPFLIIGGEPVDRRSLIDLYATVYNANVSIRQITRYEAEVIKLSENRAIAWKVAQCQELYDACEKAGVDYYTIRDVVYGDDQRFNLWWTFIMDKRGMNSKCIPKDVWAWAAWAESLGYDPKITKAILNKNKEWLKFND